MADFNKQRLFIVIAAGIGVIATFLPWASFIFGSVSGLQTYGWLSMLLYAGAGAIAFLGEKELAVEKSKMMIVVILGGAGALFSLIKIIQIFSTNMLSAGFGVYLSLLAGLALVGIYFFVNDKGEIEKP